MERVWLERMISRDFGSIRPIGIPNQKHPRSRRCWKEPTCQHRQRKYIGLIVQLEKSLQPSVEHLENGLVR